MSVAGVLDILILPLHHLVRDRYNLIAVSVERALLGILPGSFKFQIPQFIELILSVHLHGQFQREHAAASVQIVQANVIARGLRSVYCHDAAVMDFQLHHILVTPPYSKFVRNHLRAAYPPEILCRRDTDRLSLIIGAALALADHCVVRVLHVIGKVIRDVIGCRLRIDHTVRQGLIRLLFGTDAHRPRCQRCSQRPGQHPPGCPPSMPSLSWIHTSTFLSVAVPSNGRFLC